MIKNVIFDFGNVIGEWNEDKIAANYAENNEIGRASCRERVFLYV